MTLEALQELVRKISYKPNFRIHTYKVDVFDGISIIAIHDVPNVNAPDKIIPITSMQLLDPHTLFRMTEDDALRHIYAIIRRVELHELDEWFKVNGVCVNNPHPENEVRKPSYENI